MRNIGESRENVLKTISNNFLIGGSHWNKGKILDRENGNHITLYVKIKGLLFLQEEKAITTNSKSIFFIRTFILNYGLQYS